MTSAQITEVRELLGFSQRDFAKILAVELATLKRWEWYVPSWSDDPAVRYSAPRGLALEVLTGIRKAVLDAGGGLRNARTEEIARKLSLGIGAFLAHGILELVRKPT